MASRDRGGRPFGPIDAASREAAALAEFLRQLVRSSGRSLSDLTGPTGLGTTTIGRYLSGRVPKEEFVLAVVSATTGRHLDRTRALHLHAAALNPAPVEPPARRGPDRVDELQSTLIQVYQQLNRARDQRDELQHTVENSTKLVLVLIAVLYTLQHRIDELTRDRNELLANHEDLRMLTATQQLLIQAQDQERSAVVQLGAADVRRERAEQLLGQVLAQIGSHSRELSQLRRRLGVEPDEPEQQSLSPDQVSQLPPDPGAEDIARTLARVEEVNHDEDDTLNRIERELKSSAAEPDDPPMPTTLPLPWTVEEATAEGQVITFYSYKGGSGRSMALANTAWILAANGFRVLVADWDLEAPGLDRFFRPFLPQEAFDTRTGVVDIITEYLNALAWRGPSEEELHELIQRHASVDQHTIELDWQGFPEGGGLSYLSAGQGDGQYAVALSSLNWDGFYNRQKGGEFLRELRKRMTEGFDYVLIDSRSGLSDIAGVCTIELPDTVVVCFPLNEQSISGASSAALDIHQRQGHNQRPIRILPVPTRVDEGEMERVEAGRAFARTRFAGLPEGLSKQQLDAYWRSVEIPYRPFYAYDDLLAAFGDHPGQQASMLAACERLAAVVTGGRVTSLPSMDEQLRQRYLRHFLDR